MSLLALPVCLDFVFEREGGYVDHPKDPGGATNMGITIGTLSQWLGRQASKADVAALRREDAEAIYVDRYWKPVSGDLLPAGLDLVVFDAGVMSGPDDGARFLQLALKVEPDGDIGPITLATARLCRGDEIVRAACAARLAYLKRLKTWRTFGKGWTRRVALVEARALRLWAEEQRGDPLPDLKDARARAEAARVEREKAAATATGGGAVAAGGASVAAGPPSLTTLLVVIGAALALGLLLSRRALRERQHHVEREAAFAAEWKAAAADGPLLQHPPLP